MLKPLSAYQFGLHKTTLIDFPQEVAATVFVPGCNLRCPYCHNPAMVLPDAPHNGLVDGNRLMNFIRARRRLLGGICITGGEPLLSPCLPELVAFIRGQGLKVKLDTNGTFPERLARLQVDYVAMDLKTSPEKYHLLGRGDDLARRVTRAVRALLASGIPHEFRTTVVPGLVTQDDIRRICTLIRGTQRYVLSQFRPGITLDPAYAETLPYPPQVLEEMQHLALREGVPCQLRSGYKTETLLKSRRQ